MQTEALLPAAAAQVVVSTQDPLSPPQMLPLSGSIKEVISSIAMPLIAVPVPFSHTCQYLWHLCGRTVWPSGWSKASLGSFSTMSQIRAPRK